MSFDILFDEVTRENVNNSSLDFIDNIIKEAEDEFKGVSDEKLDRDNEKNSLREERKRVISKISSLKNIRGTSPSVRKRNQEASKQRSFLKMELASIDLRLKEIDIEESSIVSNGGGKGKK